jgi:hypothetical protein
MTSLWSPIPIPNGSAIMLNGSPATSKKKLEMFYLSNRLALTNLEFMNMSIYRVDGG